MTDWIKCSDRLPEDEEFYLVYSADFQDEPFRLMQGPGRCFLGATHWQKLPDPPEEVEDEW